MYCSSARGRERGGHRLFLRFPACAAPPSLFSGDREPSQQPIATTTDLILGMQTDTWGFLQEVVEEKKKLDDESEKKKQLEQAQVHGLLHLFGYDHELSEEAEAEMDEDEERLLKNLGWKGK
ncbi:hypothetical protein LXL04_010910 [Taraxacum kok-saghyz]